MLRNPDTQWSLTILLPRRTLTPGAGYRINKQRHSRYYEVMDPADELVCITVYKKGAAEVVRRLVA